MRRGCPRPEFATDEQFPFADQVYRLIVGGFLNSVSVWFRPLQHVYNAARGSVDFLKQELLEISVVPIPANPSAVVEAKAPRAHRSPLAHLDDRATLLHLDNEDIGGGRAGAA